MKKIGIYLFFTLCVYGYSSAQSGERYPASSGFETCPTDSTALNNLNVLCRVWGFVKYHHPVFADTTADADSELLRLLPQVASAQQKDRNRVLAEWISSLGRFRTVRKEYERTIDSVEWECTTDLKWIHDRRTLGGKLSRILCDLRYAERDENRYYPRWVNRQIAFPGEKALTGIASHDPDCGYRLLPLFRYWNVIEYFSPYKSLTDKPWDRVLEEYLPEAISKKGSDYERVLYRAIAELRDSHAWLPNRSTDYFWGSWWIPADTRMLGDRMIVRSSDRYTPPGSHCFRSGDEILSIDGLTIDSLKRLMRDHFSTSHDDGLKNRMNDICWLTNKNKIRVVYRRDLAVRDTVIAVSTTNREISEKRYEVDLPDTTSYRLLGDSIGYIYAETLRSEHMDGMIDALGHTKGLIVDLRGYPKNDFMALEYWLTDTTRTYMLGSFPYCRLPGIFCKFPMYSEEIPRQRECYRGDVVVLVGPGTQSAAETCVMLLQSIPGVKVIGTPSAGANGNVAPLPLTENITVPFSSIGIYYPDGGQTQRIGVRLDEVVEPTIEGIVADRDEVLERAIEIIERTAAEK